MKPKGLRPREVIAIALVGVPVVGILLGGIYLLPAVRMTKGREPWLTAILALGLAATVSAIGFSLGTPARYLALIWIFAVLVLLFAKSRLGRLDHNIERFGLVHAVTLMATVFVGMLSK